MRIPRRSRHSSAVRVSHSFMVGGYAANPSVVFLGVKFFKEGFHEVGIQRPPIAGAMDAKIEQELDVGKHAPRIGHQGADCVIM